MLGSRGGWHAELQRRPLCTCGDATTTGSGHRLRRLPGAWCWISSFVQQRAALYPLPDCIVLWGRFSLCTSRMTLLRTSSPLCPGGQVPTPLPSEADPTWRVREVRSCRELAYGMNDTAVDLVLMKRDGLFNCTEADWPGQASCSSGGLLADQRLPPELCSTRRAVHGHGCIRRAPKAVAPASAVASIRRARQGVSSHRAGLVPTRSLRSPSTDVTSRAANRCIQTGMAGHARSFVTWCAFENPAAGAD